jgi:hypothetical protein
MSGKSSGRVHEMDVSGGTKEVLIAIADCADIHGENATASYDLLAWMTGYSRRWVIGVVKVMKARGWLTSKPGKEGRNIYAIHFEKMPQKPTFREWLIVNGHQGKKAKAGGEVSSPPQDADEGCSEFTPGGEVQEFTPGGEVASSPITVVSTVVPTVDTILEPAQLPSNVPPWRSHPAVKAWCAAWPLLVELLGDSDRKKIAATVANDEVALAVWDGVINVWLSNPTWFPTGIDNMLDRYTKTRGAGVGGNAKQNPPATDDIERVNAQLADMGA